MATVDEFKGLNIVVEQMSKTIERLRSEQKAKESAIKELNEQLVLVEMDCKEKMTLAKKACDEELARLEKAVQPLRELKQECDKVRGELVAMSQDKLNAIAELAAAKNSAIREADEELKKRASKLAGIESAISTCKAKVASL
jgi:chromosome segregation ATPase